MDVPDLREVEMDGSVESDGIPAPSPTPRLSLLLDYRKSVSPHDSLLTDFHFQASVFPLDSIPELINLVLSHRSYFSYGPLEQFFLTAEDIARCFQPSGSSFVETERLKIEETDVEREFECTPFLIFFTDNSDTIVSSKSKKRQNGDSATTVKKVKKAVIRLLSAIEQIPTLLANSPFTHIISQIQLQSYLFQSKKASIQQVISARTVANYLLAYLPTLPADYQMRDFRLLFKETAEKITKRRKKNQKYESLNQLIMLGIRTVEGLFSTANRSFQPIRGVLNELKTKVLSIEIPVCVNIHEVDGGGTCLTVTKEGFIPSVMKGNCEVTVKKKLFGSLEPGKVVEEVPKSSHCGKIGEFINHFSHLQQVLDATHTLADLGNVKSCFSSYLELVKEEVRTTVKSDNLTEEILEELINEVEDHITRQMYGDVFPSWASKEDIALHGKCRLLYLLPASSFSLPYPPDPETLSKSSSLLDSLSGRMTPHEKLLLLVEFCSITLSEIELCYDLVRNDSETDAVRLIAYAIVQCVGGKKDAPMLNSNVNYVYKLGMHRKWTAGETAAFGMVKKGMDFVGEFEWGTGEDGGV